MLSLYRLFRDKHLGVMSDLGVYIVKVLWLWSFHLSTMASLASRSQLALRSAACAPRVAVKVSTKPAQAAAYSLLARTAVAGAPRVPTVQVR